VKRGNLPLRVEPDLALRPGDSIVVTARPGVLADIARYLGPEIGDDPEFPSRLSGFLPIWVSLSSSPSLA
jgi:hypothetical protein